ncbi:oligosaccharide flippase family protein [Acutalibacter caecimuris]|uniref:oligosaccharide flippase family protein n=1 Tax=Acutalibacter caecimuris TaxID=3093657 RepID=UPI002AC9C9C1|nr:oligosaccharide flippase family protein [Acutalibacter sp. M00118]
MTKKKFFFQGAVLTLVSLFLRITNMGYRSYLSQQIGAEGMGLYQLIFSIFMLTVTLSTSGISLAVTRLVTAAIAGGRRQTVRSVVARCFGFCLTISLCIALCLFLLADFAAVTFLGDPQAAPCLRILGVGLPFMALCTCMKGYFLAVDESLSTAASDALEQVLTIAATVCFFWYFAPQSIQAACLAAMAASTLGEAVSCAASWCAYRKSLKKNTPAEKEKSRGVLRSLRHIALPCTLSSAARSALNTGENLLIPRELQRFGLGYSQSLSQYGLLQGMAMPMLYFPSSFLTSFASLLIPKIARERELSHEKAVAYISGRAVQAALCFGMFFSALFLAFGDSWGRAFYHSESAGAYLRVLAPLVPLTYLDVVVDSLLKGLDEQFNSMKYNFADSLIRVILVLCLLQFFGMESYVAILFFSTIFNASLSLHRLMKVSHLHISLPEHILLPMACAAGSVGVSRMLLDGLAAGGFLLVLMQTALSAALFAGGYLSIMKWMGKKTART